MTVRFQGFRVPSARLHGADYGAGCFFVTVATAGRAPCLGRVEGDRTRLSASGQIVRDEWRRTAVVRPGVTLDAFVVMPDHVHGVLWLDDVCPCDPRGYDRRDAPPGRLHADAVPSGPDAPPGRLYNARSSDGVRPWRPNTLGTIVNHWKGRCTRRIRADVDPSFAWQPRFYDALVRDARHLAHVRHYLLTKPARYSEGGAPTASVAIATRISSDDAAAATCASSPMVASRSA